MKNFFKLMIVLHALACLVLLTIIIQNAAKDGQMPLFIGGFIMSSIGLVFYLKKLKQKVLAAQKAD